MLNRIPHKAPYYFGNPESLDNPSSNINLASIFLQRHGSYANELTLFLAHFNAIPNFINEVNIDCKKANAQFAQTFKTNIWDTHYSKIYFDNSKEAEIDDIFYLLYDDLIVDFDTNNSIVRFLFKETDIEKVEYIISFIKQFRKKKEAHKPEISLLMTTSNGIDTKTLGLSKLKLDIHTNYNDDFLPIHEVILKRLRKKNDKGLVLLHGKPGTGKTSYIRYLISKVRKNVIFLPPNMAQSITNPGIISTLVDNPNSIFVIEDAENIVMNREKDGNSPVSALLNITDGLLSDCLNIQIICSFNTDISQIDSALMRKGRLIAKYEFGDLNTEKAQLLSNKLGLNTSIQEPMSLATIYNQKELQFENNKQARKIGFGSFTK